MKCPDCREGQSFVHASHKDPAKHGFQWVTCFTCNGTAQVPDDHHERRAAGQKLRDDRIARGLTLGDEARRLGITVSEVSGRERGKEWVRPPPPAGEDMDPWG